MRPGGGVRAVVSALCWVLAVLSGVLTGAAFAGGGLMCQAGQRTVCAPQTWLLVIGIALALGFGVLAASLYKPRSKPKPRRPWEYPP
jgi:phosphotransferase system  glucose/maltose/N-acetylglucosamine-specific IIC component